jgi:hypothetical protein
MCINVYSQNRCEPCCGCYANHRCLPFSVSPKKEPERYGDTILSCDPKPQQVFCGRAYFGAKSGGMKRNGLPPLSPFTD